MSKETDRAAQRVHKAGALHRKSISHKVCFSLLAILIPALAALIITACIVTAGAVAETQRRTSGPPDGLRGVQGRRSV